MANTTLVNGQITDAVTQANVKVLGDAPGQAMATIYQVMAHSTGMGMQNAVAAQQQIGTLSAATTTQGVNLLFSMDPASAAVSTQDLLSGNSLATMLAGLQAAVSSNQQFVKTAQSTPPPPPPIGS
jgi:hypothetical protein